MVEKVQKICECEVTVRESKRTSLAKLRDERRSVGSVYRPIGRARVEST
jgi:hypothetical protein